VAQARGQYRALSKTTISLWVLNKKKINSILAEELAGSQKGLCSMELLN
jgi:hypothetical protein